MDTQLKDSNGRYLGKIEESGNKRRLINANNIYLGTYDRGTNQTVNANNVYVGSGDLLGTLLRNDR